MKLRYYYDSNIRVFRIKGKTKCYVTKNYGPYIMDEKPELLKDPSNIDSIYDCEGCFVQFNDGMMINCLVVKHNNKIGLLFADGDFTSCHFYAAEPKGALFQYDRISIYPHANGINETAYAIAYSDNKWSVLELNATEALRSMYSKVVSILEKQDDANDFNNYPTSYIPEEYLWGSSFSPFQFTPDHVKSLKENDILVYGSNLAGKNTGGLAKFAKEQFGAKDGIAFGINGGHCYAIPTMNVSLEQLEQYIEGFLGYASLHPWLTFYVTRIGCGNAGWKDEQIAPLFSQILLANVILPKEWIKQIIYFAN